MVLDLKSFLGDHAVLHLWRRQRFRLNWSVHHKRQILLNWVVTSSDIDLANHRLCRHLGLSLNLTSWNLNSLRCTCLSLSRLHDHNYLLGLLWLRLRIHNLERLWLMNLLAILLRNLSRFDQLSILIDENMLLWLNHCLRRLHNWWLLYHCMLWLNYCIFHLSVCIRRLLYHSWLLCDDLDRPRLLRLLNLIRLNQVSITWRISMQLLNLWSLLYDCRWLFDKVWNRLNARIRWWSEDHALLSINVNVLNSLWLRLWRRGRWLHNLNLTRLRKENSLLSLGLWKDLLNRLQSYVSYWITNLL